MNVFWCIYCLAFSIAGFVMLYFMGIRNISKEKRCSEKTVGKVIRYSIIYYNDVRLPVVEYFVGEHKYTVVGPKFKGIIKKFVHNPFNGKKREMSNNLTTRENLPDVLRVSCYNNSVYNYEVSPLVPLYPIGSEVVVYYNPNKPKDAFVQRYVSLPWGLTFAMPLLFGVGFLIFGIWCFINM